MTDDTHFEVAWGDDGYRLACGLDVLEVCALEMDVRPSTDVRDEVTCRECLRAILPPHWALRFPATIRQIEEKPRPVGWVIDTSLGRLGMVAASPDDIEQVRDFYREEWT